MSEKETDLSLGENPALPASFGQDVVRSIALRRRDLRRRLAKHQKQDHEVGAKIYSHTDDGHRVEAWDGPLSQLHIKMQADKKSALVRFKDTAKQEFQDHPLRDGVVLTVGGLMLLGASIYARHETKK